MNNPKISVLMPVYNTEKFLKEAIDSILNQTFKDFELLIVNDASTDRSKEIILSYIDSRIRYFENNKNFGVARALNRGLRLARAELVARMDADEVSFSNRLELQYKKMQQDKEIAVLASDYDVMDESGRYLYTEKRVRSPEEIYYKLQFHTCLGHSVIMFNKHIVLDIFNGYDKNHKAEDYDLWLRISTKYKISIINTVLLKSRISKNSLMGSTGKKTIDDATLLAKKNLESLTDKKINLDKIKILRRIFVAPEYNSSIEFSKEEIKKAIIILGNVNNKILTHRPLFLNESLLEKISTEKLNSMKRDLFLAKLFNLKFGFTLKFLFRIFLFFQRLFIRKFNQLLYFLVTV